jgi:uncharacterized protein (TIGR02246 family)
MRPYFGVRAVVVVCLGLALSACSTAEPPPEPAPVAPAPDRAADEAAFRAMASEGESQINSRDFAAWASAFAADGDAIFPGTPKTTGPAEILQLMETGWAEAPPERQISLTVDSVRFVADDVAVVDYLAEFSAGEPTTDRGTAVWVRAGDTWQTVTLRVYGGMTEP